MEVAKNHLKTTSSHVQEEEDEIPWTEHFRRAEQDTIDRVVKGEEPGHYYVLLGPKVRGVVSLPTRAISPCQLAGLWEGNYDLRCHGYYTG